MIDNDSIANCMTGEGHEEIDEEWLEECMLLWFELDDNLELIVCVICSDETVVTVGIKERWWWWWRSRHRRWWCRGALIHDQPAACTIIHYWLTWLAHLTDDDMIRVYNKSHHLSINCRCCCCLTLIPHTIQDSQSFLIIDHEMKWSGLLSLIRLSGSSMHHRKDDELVGIELVQ